MVRIFANLFLFRITREKIVLTTRKLSKKFIPLQFIIMMYVQFVLQERVVDYFHIIAWKKNMYGLRDH